MMHARRMGGWQRLCGCPSNFGAAFDFRGALDKSEGVVKRHVERIGVESLVLFLLKPNSFLTSTKARFVNLAVDSGSTNHLFGH